MTDTDKTIAWLLDSDEPWTRYRTRVDLLGQSETDPATAADRQAMLAHPQVKMLMTHAATWGEFALKRHNDASHPLHALSTLADFGLRAEDPGMPDIIMRLMSHQAPEGAFQTLVFIPNAFGGPDADMWSWLACDAPTLLYVLLAMGYGADPRVQKSVDQLTSLSYKNGYRCTAAPELGRFHGPGRREDPCPLANLYVLKALSLLPEQSDSQAVLRSAEMLLNHWAQQREKKYYLFGIGSDFRKLKYPYMWYNLLHVCEVLSRYRLLHTDARFYEMLSVLISQTDVNGRFTATSSYQAWKNWSFANKKSASPWLTFLVKRIQRRIIEDSR